MGSRIRPSSRGGEQKGGGGAARWWSKKLSQLMHFHPFPLYYYYSSPFCLIHQAGDVSIQSKRAGWLAGCCVAVAARQGCRDSYCCGSFLAALSSSPFWLCVYECVSANKKVFPFFPPFFFFREWTSNYCCPSYCSHFLAVLWLEHGARALKGWKKTNRNYVLMLMAGFLLMVSFKLLPLWCWGYVWVWLCMCVIV